MNKLVLINDSFGSKAVHSHSDEHNWVTVVNPTNHRLLLQACDDCGVVKSENSIRRLCKAPKGQRLVSSRMGRDVQLVG